MKVIYKKTPEAYRFHCRKGRHCPAVSVLLFGRAHCNRYLCYKLIDTKVPYEQKITTAEFIEIAQLKAKTN